MTLSAPRSHVGGLSRRAAWLLALTATFTMAVSYVDRQTLAVLSPTVRAALEISPEQYGWLISAFSFAYLVGTPLSGRLIDKIGARRGLLGAVAAWSAVAALHAVAPSFGVLFALRIALGLTESPSFPGAVQTVHRALPPQDRARGMGVLFTGSSLGAIVASIVAPKLEGAWGFRAAFLITSGIGLVWVPVWLWAAYRPAARVALDAHLGDGGAPRVPALSLVKHPAVLRAMLVVMAASPFLAFGLNWGSELLTKTHAVRQEDVGRYLWVPPVLFDLGAIGFGHAASARWKRSGGAPERGLLALAMLLAALLCFVPLARSAHEVSWLIGIAFAGGGGLFALLTADMLARVPPNAVSTAGGLTGATQALCYIVVNPIIGRSVERSGSFTPSLVTLGLWIVPGCVAWILWRPPPPT